MSPRGSSANTSYIKISRSHSKAGSSSSRQESRDEILSVSDLTVSVPVPGLPARLPRPCNHDRNQSEYVSPIQDHWDGVDPAKLAYAAHLRDQDVSISEMVKAAGITR